MTPPNAPLVSVIIPSYSRPDALERCLSGFCQLAHVPFVWELIVVDDGSPTDLAAQLQDQFTTLPIRWLRQENAGPATARNAGARAANGRFLLFTDDDCVPYRSWLREFSEQLLANPTSLVGGQTINALRDNPYAETSQLLIRYLYRYFEGRNGRFFTSNNFGMARQLFWQIGGFDEKMPLAAGEDRELCDRWQAAELELVYAPAAKIDHYHALTLRSFWRQHFNYGRGARQYHQLKAHRQQQNIQVEPLSFYAGLLFSGDSIYFVPLLFLTQVANVLGFFWERPFNKGGQLQPK